MNYKEIEIHCLICKRDLLLAINNFKSLCKFEEFAQMPIFFHDDGSLSSTDKTMLMESIQNATFIDRAWADQQIARFIDKHPFSKTYRLVDKHIHLWHKIKLYDYYFFSKTKKILGMDTDLLFLRKPQNILNYINNNIPFYFPDVNDAYCFQEPKDEIPVPSRTNTGLIYIPSSEYYNLDDIEHALTNLLKNGVNYFPAWIEQSAFAHMFYKNGKYLPLSANLYRIPYFQQVNVDEVECLHFVSYPAVRETYDRYMDYLKFENGTKLYDKNFVVKFDTKNIDLSVKIYKTESFLNFNYGWFLEKAGQNALDHAFKIEAENGFISESKFQSEKSGFFFVPSKLKNLKIYHTTDWYGKMDWQLIDTVSL